MEANGCSGFRDVFFRLSLLFSKQVPTTSTGLRLSFWLSCFGLCCLLLNRRRLFLLALRLFRFGPRQPRHLRILLQTRPFSLALLLFSAGPRSPSRASSASESKIEKRAALDFPVRRSQEVVIGVSLRQELVQEVGVELGPSIDQPGGLAEDRQFLQRHLRAGDDERLFELVVSQKRRKGLFCEFLFVRDKDDRSDIFVYLPVACLSHIIFCLETTYDTKVQGYKN